MKRALTPVRLLLLLLAAGALSGCFQSLVLLKVNKDGSGTLEETMLLTDAFSQMIATLSGQEADGGQSRDVDEARLREKAQAMGEGVRLVSAEPVKDDKGTGYRAVYSFPDVNKIRVNQQPNAGLPAVPGAGGHHGWALPDRPLGHFADGTGCGTQLDPYVPGGDLDLNAVCAHCNNILKKGRRVAVADVEGNGPKPAI